MLASVKLTRYLSSWGWCLIRARLLASDQEQPCPDDGGSDGSRDVLAARCETLDGDGCCHDSHRTQVHDPDDEEVGRQAGTAANAVARRR
jgi:hypothetical protein